MTPEYSRTLRRQIQKYLADRSNDPQLTDFLNAVNDSYRQGDRDREMLERSLDLTSGELTALNEKIRQEKTLALEKLTENEQILTSINQNLSEGVFRIAQNGSILFANRAFLDLLDLPKDQSPILQNFEELFSNPETWFTLKSMIEINGFVKNEETQMLTGSAGRIWALISMVRVTVPGKGEVYDGSMVNITQQKETEKNLRRANDILANTINIRKKAEEDLRRALEKERELAELKSRLVSMTSHEFRTPLTTIQTNTELLAMKLASIPSADSEKVSRHMNRITAEISKLTRLMDDILLMGRYESGKIIFQPEDTDLVAMLSELIQSKGHMSADERMITLTVTGEPRPIKADTTLLTHALTNLITNALKYSPGAKAPEAQVTFLSDKVEVKFQDYGIGIPANEQPKLFQTFYRATNASNIQGTGMGLVIVKQFIEMHGGTISLTSEQNAGTCVTVVLPAGKSEQIQEQ